MYKIDVNNPPVALTIGQSGENQFRPVSIDWSSWKEDYPDGSVSIILSRPDGQCYPAVVNITESPYVWTPDNVDTGVSGRGKMEIRLDDNGTVGKTLTFDIIVNTSLSAGAAPDPAPSWYDEAKEARDEAVEAAVQAEAAVAHYPYIDPDTGTWWAWDATNEEMVDTEIPATGPQGETGPVGPQGETGPAGPTALIGTASGSVTSFPDGAEAPAKNVTAQIVAVQDLHGYDKPWPGGGWKNLFDKSNPNVFNGYFNGSHISSNAGHRIVYIPCSPNTTYTAQKIAQYTNDRFGLAWSEDAPANGISIYDSQTKTSGFVVGNKYSFTLTTGATAAYLLVWARGTAGGNYETIQIEAGSEATDYAPYSNICPISGWSGCNVTHNEETAPISFGQTVYDGTLNVTTGVLTITHALMDISSATWAYVDTYDYPLFRAAVADAAKVSGVVSVASSKYDATTNRSYTTFRSNDFNGKVCVVTDQAQPWIALQDHALTSLDAFNAAASDLQIVYELATPQTIQLPPTEIAILQGGNTVSADCGDISVEYYSHPTEPTSEGEYVLHCTVTASGRSFAWEVE